MRGWGREEKVIKFFYAKTWCFSAGPFVPGGQLILVVMICANSGVFQNISRAYFRCISSFLLSENSTGVLGYLEPL